MEQKKRRGENWSAEEKEILRQLIGVSANIIEDKSTKTSINIQKVKEWKIISNRFNEITGKRRSEGEIKLAWKRMKLSAKANISFYKREQAKTGGGQKPPSPSPEELEIMAIAPHEFIIEVNDYDSDAVIPVAITTSQNDIAGSENPSLQTGAKVTLNEIPVTADIMKVIAGPSHVKPDSNIERKLEQDMVAVKSIPDNRSMAIQDDIVKKQNETGGTKSVRKINKKNTNISEEMRQTIVHSNTEFKKRQIEMMEVEHQYNVKIAKLQLKKLELEIALLDAKKKNQYEQ